MATAVRTNEFECVDLETYEVRGRGLVRSYYLTVSRISRRWSLPPPNSNPALFNELRSRRDNWVGAPRKGEPSKPPKQTEGQRESFPKITPTDEKWPKDLSENEKDTDFDWGSILNEVTNQGKLLDICWAIAICRSMEAGLYINNRDEKGVELSVQHLVRNIRKKNGTGMIKSIEEVASFLENEGLVSEATCPFEGKLGGACSHASDDGILVKATRVHTIENIDEEELLKLVKSHPIVVNLEAWEEFCDYKGGIFEGPKKPSNRGLNRHTGILYGYGTTPEGIHYWKFQNSSWGKTWGENGYAKIVRQCSMPNDKKSLIVDAYYIQL